jgi:PAS domain S-box-containing protein
MAAYFLGLLWVLNLVILGWLFLRSPQHRWPVGLMLSGQLVGRTLFLMERVFLLRSVPPLDLLGMSFEFLMYAIALFGFRIFDPIPLARRTAIEQLHSGMLVLDTQGKIVSLNPAAAVILGSPAKRLLGRSIQELLPSGFELAGDLQATVEAEISLGDGPEIRSYQLEASALNDWRGLAVGRLLLLHDVTDQKRAQAQLVEQQRALAMLHERERLARELHDSIGQTLGFAGFQLDAASRLIQDGQAVSAVTQLNRLAGIVRDAHDDLREYILDLHSAPAPQQPFFTALRRYLKGYTNNYGIQATLSADERLGEEPFSLDDRMEVYRILQEALSNARKHAQARCVQVSFTLDGDSIRMTIQDDGAGFDPTQSLGEGHFGLRFMRERAEQMGGVLRVDSAPGGGTRVSLEIAYARASGR